MNSTIQLQTDQSGRWFVHDKEDGSFPVIDTLKKTFGFSSFRPFQEEIVSHILEKRDVFAVMPTGGGKSLCYQLPAKIMKGMVVVVSPLISLMKDQVDGALETGIRAAFINSSLDGEESRDILQQVRENRLEMLYIAPERFSMDYFLHLLKTVDISLFAIDEAHCISEWGHDFRPDYLNLALIRAHFPGIPIAAFTATATAKVQEDVTCKLKLRSPYTVRASFDRPNLFYAIERKRDVDSRVLSFILQHRNEPGIVYRTTRKAATAMAAFLCANNINASCYHAGLTRDERHRNQEAFNNDEIQVMVATIAFGMGIDKSNVRFIIHADLPKNLEGYYQETGRAGRDGETAHCLLLFGRGDIPRLRYFIDQIDNETEKAAAVMKLNHVARYASQSVCRRSQLLAYFGETYGRDNCGHCDICTSELKQADITIESQMLMSAVIRSGERFGVGHVIDIVRGANTKRIREFRHHELKTYGIGKDKEKEFWLFIVDELLARGLLVQEGDRFPILVLSEKGRGVLFNREEIMAVIKESPVMTPPDREPIRERFECDLVLLEELKKLRKGLARAHKVPPYIIFSDKTLHEMACYLPVTPESFLLIAGVGEKKLHSYGGDFINLIKNYVDENPGHSRPMALVKPENKVNGKKGQTVEESYALYEQGLSMEEIAEKRGLVLSTIVGHMEKCILMGYEVEIERLVPKEKVDIIKEFIENYSVEKLTPIVEHFDGEVTFEDVRLVRAWVTKKGKK